MGTLDELIHYCRIEDPIGSLVLIGESGCGKTYLIERELREALEDTHCIVRVSLFGINSIGALHDAVKKQWLYALSPLFTKFSRHPDQIEKWRNFAKAGNSVLQIINPRAGSLSNTLMNTLDYIVVSPVVEDHITKKEKRVVLVFDDVDRTTLNSAELLGCINDYCENKNFSTIIIANREYFANPNMEDFIRSVREKTVAYTVLNCPDFKNIVHDLIGNWNWRTEEYAEFLKEQEETIVEIFASEPDTSGTQEAGAALVKNHNIRSLITSLESFFRIYYHICRAGVSDICPYFRSFLAFSLAEKGGFCRDGKTSYTFSDEEISRLYPQFSADCLFDSVRLWIRLGEWNKKQFLEELSRISGADLSELMHEEDGPA